MIYPWYELIENSDSLTQGDIIKKCPVPVLKELTISEGNIDADIEYFDGIILTQACDIENKKVDHIILCEIITKTIFEETLLSEGKTQGEIKNQIKGILKGQQHAYHLINKFTSDNYTEDYCVISFKTIFSLPIDLVRRIAMENGKRLRLCPPYREHLSQAFARYFMRVGLPINIDIG